MSRLSEWFHKNGNVLRVTVAQLETIDIPKEQKKSIAISVVKILHVETGVGPFDAALEQAVEHGIDFILAEIRSTAKRYDGAKANPTPVPEPQPVPPPALDKYGTLLSKPIPTDITLINLGFVVGDVVDDVKDGISPTVFPFGAYSVRQAGTSARPGSVVVRTIGG
jgi:hypothetical protein